MALFGNSLDKLIRESTVDIRSLSVNPERTVVVNVDTVCGFFREGALASPRLFQTEENILRVNRYFLKSPKLFFVDSHTAASAELASFPPHCITDAERQIIPTLAEFVPNSTVIHKNSVNGFLAKAYLKWLSENLKKTDNFVITGGCTDLCVMQYALSQKAYLNDNNLNARIIVMENAVQTFDNPGHDGNAMHSFALYNMYINGITLARI